MSQSEGSEPPRHAIPSSPLEGIRVVEWGEGISAPYCAKLLAEFGADVVKIEPPGGDRARRLGPFPGATPHPERSGLFLFANLGKRGVTLDTSTPSGIERISPSPRNGRRLRREPALRSLE